MANKTGQMQDQQPAINFKPLTAEELVIATKVASLMRETASSQHYISDAAAAALSGGSVYTVHFHHLQSGANLTVKCPTLDVAQCVWDALNKSSTLTLSTSRPTL